MFCSDDKHPNNLVEGHINNLVQRAIQKGIDPFKVLQVACVNPVSHYRLDVGQLNQGDDADFIVVNNLKDFEVLETYIKGEIVAQKGESLLARTSSEVINNFKVSPKVISEFKIEGSGRETKVIEVMDGQLVTGRIVEDLPLVGGLVQSSIQDDILKISVVNRYEDSEPALGFIRGFGLTKGAIGSSVAHDSHNIIAVGADDESICRVVNNIIGSKGGIAAWDGSRELLLQLPVAGLMTNEDGYEVAEGYSQIDHMAKEMGSGLVSPFMSLSFMALLVIPSLKLSDKGLFDGDVFKLTGLFS